MLTSTLKKFDYPHSLIHSYKHWQVLLRPMQPTLGSLILICKDDVSQYSEISIEAANEQAQIVKDIENILFKRFHYSKINYLMLMMVDPAVHFHIIPRYENSVEFCNKSYEDKYWPTPPDLAYDLGLDSIYHQELLKTLKNDFSNLDNQPVQKRYHRLFTSGCFDVFHLGHLNILKKSKELCDYLIVGVSTDELIEQSKGRPPIIPFEERIQILEANIYVDEVIPQVDKNKQNIVDLHHIDAISVGSDWKGKYPKVSCDMVYFDYTPNVSSTILKEKLNLLPKTKT